MVVGTRMLRSTALRRIGKSLENLHVFGRNIGRPYITARIILGNQKINNANVKKGGELEVSNFLFKGKRKQNAKNTKTANAKYVILASKKQMEQERHSLPEAEMLPKNENLGGYIFMCNNDTMEEHLQRQLFGLSRRCINSVRAIKHGLPLFLYNYTTQRLHGIFEADGVGDDNLDPTAWKDEKCKGESRFPAQVRIRIRKLCKPLKKNAFVHVLKFNAKKFRLELSEHETSVLIGLFEQASV
ncbi:B2 protein-like [Salvia hispanica]|uniref:B2 protein-like n=1 Tax=Salvia hispanica TaxID=49212 RepID=UPI0020096077|nr:B2 protein-like [Salvia hispanica]